VGHVAHKVEMRNMYKIMVTKPEGKKLLGRLGHRWENNIKMDLKAKLKGVVYDRDWWRAPVNIATNLWVA
jgi:hypothetical protein